MKKQDYTRRRRALSSKLVEAREAAGFTQKQVAETGIIAQSDLSKIENGMRKVDFLFLIELAELYGKSVEFFVPDK